MKILAISKETPGVDWDSLEELLKQEALALHELYQEELVREFYLPTGGRQYWCLNHPPLRRRNPICPGYRSSGKERSALS